MRVEPFAIQPGPRTLLSRSASQPDRSAQASAVSNPKPRLPRASPSMPYLANSIMIERSVGSWISMMKTPAPIECGVPAGT